jgi:hypothetical protein
MAILQLDCPHCRTVHAPFSGSHHVHVHSGKNLYDVFLQCGVCGHAIVAEVLTGSISLWREDTNRDAANGILRYWPENRSDKAPKHTDATAERYFLQGVDSLARQNFDAAGMMFRKTLDAALKCVHLEGKGTLEKRIDSLPPETWCHTRHENVGSQYPIIGQRGGSR